MQFILRCKLYFDFVKVIFRLAAEVKVNPQRARGTHRAEGATLLPTGKNIASSLYKVSLPGDSHVASLLRMTEVISFVAVCP